MGCGTLSSKRSGFDTTIKQPKILITSNNSAKTSGDNYSQSLSPLKFQKSCQSLLPIFSDGTKILQDYELLLFLSINCAEEYKNIMEFSSTFLQIFSNFKISVHACCIPSFTLTKALKILLSFAYSKSPCSKGKIVKKEKFPFYDSGSLPELEEVEELLYYVRHIMKSEDFLKDLLHVEYVLRIFQSFEGIEKDLELGVKILREAAEGSREVLGIVRRINEEMKVFFNDFGKIDLEARIVGKEFEGICDVQVADIVHYVYLNSI